MTEYSITIEKFKDILKKNKNMYNEFINEKNYSQELQNSITNTVENLEDKKIGMLLGKIQSGKTKAFIGVIAKAFDEGFDICCILTKGTNVLVEQTKKRLEAEYKTFINKNDIQVFDIMKVKTKDKRDKEQKLNNYQIDNSKLIFVIKKEKTNLTKLYDLFSYYPKLINKKVLIIDDEADYGGIGFKKKNDEVEINRLPEIINNLRTRLSEENYRLLQVTATPYSLYLQPKEEVQVNNTVAKMLRPAFTELVPIHDRYIGGKQYFEYSQTPDINPTCRIFP